MLTSPFILVASQEQLPKPPPAKEPSPNVRTNVLKTPGLDLDGFNDIDNPSGPNARTRVRFNYRRDNPRSTVMLVLGRKATGRPPLVDAAGKPVKQNLTFTAKNPNLGPVKVYATKLKDGPFFTQWIKTPKGATMPYLQITGSRLTAAEVRKVVESVRFEVAEGK